MGRGGGWDGREGKGGEGGREGEGREGQRGEDVEGPGKWSAPGPVLVLGGPAAVRAIAHTSVLKFHVHSCSNCFPVVKHGYKQTP